MAGKDAKKRNGLVFTVCSWCNALIDVSGTGVADERSVTHGLCEPCGDRLGPQANGMPTPSGGTVEKKGPGDPRFAHLSR